MVEEFHNSYLHVVVDCKTGNIETDKGVELVIKAYLFMVIDALEKGRMKQLIDKSRALAVEFLEAGSQK
jgi:hypothetical protein